jgi:hypothetical protein
VKALPPRRIMKQGAYYSVVGLAALPQIVGTTAIVSSNAMGIFTVIEGNLELWWVIERFGAGSWYRGVVTEWKR